jgi:hypothetical protein
VDEANNVSKHLQDLEKVDRGSCMRLKEAGGIES